MAGIARTEGQRSFGNDPAGYDQARPDYPALALSSARRCRVFRSSCVPANRISAGLGGSSNERRGAAQKSPCKMLFPQVA